MFCYFASQLRPSVPLYTMPAMTKSVSAIFGSEAKVKLMRLFLFNPDSIYKAKYVIDRVKESPRIVRKELNELSKAGLIKRRTSGYALNKAYPHRASLENFLTEVGSVSNKEIVQKISKAGNIKLIIVSGLFIQNPESRVDLLVVGDGLRKGPLRNAVAHIESLLGKEVRYAAFETPDWKYRVGLYDKLIRDILDFPHEKLLNKLLLS